MRIESLKIKNYKVFKDVYIDNIPGMAVFLGRNGVGKTTFFDVFGFLHECLSSNVKSALAARGGFKEVISRDQTGDIEFEIKFRPAENEPLITYEIAIGLDAKNQPVVKKEILRMRRGQKGAPWKILDFAMGAGVAADGEITSYSDVKLATRNLQKLDSPDILAIKGLGQFKEFKAVSTFRRMIEDWYVSDFKIDAARSRSEAIYADRLTKDGENLSAVAKYLYDEHPDIFAAIIEKMKDRVPGVTDVSAQITEDGYIVLRFQNGQFKNPFSAKFVSDGTIKMFTYLVLLNDPVKHALLCIEEPENQLYPELLAALSEEFRQYSSMDGQVFVSTHSPDFLNSVELDEVFVLQKENGFTTIKRASDDELVRSLVEAGDGLGPLWRQGLLEER